MSDAARSHWEIPCTDAVGRPQILHITVTRVGHVSLITPAGGSATLPPDRVGVLRDLLAQARGQALRGARGATWLDLVGMGLGVLALVGVFRLSRGEWSGPQS